MWSFGTVVSLIIIIILIGFIIELMQINITKSDEVKVTHFKSEQDQETYSVSNRRLEIVKSLFGEHEKYVF